eukprot:UC4_evm2s1162
MANAGRFVDRNPDLPYAGLSAPLAIERVADAIEPGVRGLIEDPCPQHIQIFRNSFRPGVGERRVFHANANDRINYDESHGIVTKSSEDVADVVNPPPATRFRTKLEEQTTSRYHSRKKPLGRVPDPVHPIPTDRPFGTTSVKESFAKDCIQPVRTSEDELIEEAARRKLYLKSHNSYLAGEQTDRNFDWSTFKKDDKYGLPTPHDNDGGQVRSVLTWAPDAEDRRKTRLTSTRLGDFKERYETKLGEVRDPLKDTMKVGPDHSFGHTIPHDGFGAGDLLHMRDSKGYMHGKDAMRALVASIRHQLKVENFQNYNGLREAFRAYDKDDSGTIDAIELKEVLESYNLPVDISVIEEIIKYCDKDENGHIDYPEFANFLNWKNGDASKLSHQTDPTITTPISTKLLPSYAKDRTFGVPSVRADLPAPKFRRVADHQNYGDEGNALSLINPSIYGQHGLVPRDFLDWRPKGEIRIIFENLGMKLSDEDFDIAWKKAATDQGGVSIESFRNAAETIFA